MPIYKYHFLINFIFSISLKKQKSLISLSNIYLFIIIIKIKTINKSINKHKHKLLHQISESFSKIFIKFTKSTLNQFI